MKDLVEYIATSLVENPEAVRVHERRRRGMLRYELHVAQEDMGRVIGKNGRVANAMRQLLRAAATVRGKGRVDLNIVD
ncbi:MAG: KH domain-containing protein [Chloroflexi bacterium]|nr:MAG: KH domain-containing protein [Chloroflexota bacterium]